MANSYNGWSAAPGWSVSGGQLKALVVAGEPFSPGVRAGDVHTVLEYVANQLHRRVEPVVRPDWHQADDWGYSYRPNKNNPSQLSCHASGTAIDYNATRHPNGKRGTWNAAQLAEIRKIFAEVNGTVRNIAYDEMHFEIYGNAAQVAAAAAKIRGGGGGPTPGPQPGGGQYEERVNAPLGTRILSLYKVGSDVEFVQRWHGLKVDGEFGPATEQAVRNTQARNGKTVDGVVGPETWAVMGVGSGNAIPPVPSKPTWDFPSGHYLGHIDGPNESHGGAVDKDRDNVLYLQRNLIAAGCVPGVRDWRDGWADGLWHDATTVAVREWFRRYRPGQKYTDRVYSDDYAAM